MDALFRFRAAGNTVRLGLVSGDCWIDLTAVDPARFADLAMLLRREDWRKEVVSAQATCQEQRRPLPRPVAEVLGLRLPCANGAAVDTHAADVPGMRLVCPIDRQEVWGAGVTYRRSELARRAESGVAADAYSRVYVGARPEIFFKATPHRCVGPGDPITLRPDAAWSVPEPELAVFLSSRLEVVGYTIGNDVTARDIEGQNPLYLPQAKIWVGSCSVGPVIVLRETIPDISALTVHLEVVRDGRVVTSGEVGVDAMRRSLNELIEHLRRANAFPDGVLLLTGTGIVPEDTFALRVGDVVSIGITGLGRLVNHVQAA